MHGVDQSCDFGVEPIEHLVSIAGCRHEDVGKNSECIVRLDPEAALAIKLIDGIEDDFFAHIVEKPDEFSFDVGNLQPLSRWNKDSAIHNGVLLE